MSDTDFESYRATLWPSPLRPLKATGNARRLGVEIEFSGLELNQIAGLTREVLGGDIETVSDYECYVRNSRLGDFGIELDFAYLKKLGRERQPSVEFVDLNNLAESGMALLAKQIVPFEIVSPPLPMDQVWHLDTLIVALRQAGAKGTGHATSYAFGLHFNPELPDTTASTILAYIQSFLCLFEWLRERSKVDLSRRVTPYITPFSRQYVLLACEPDYSPSAETLINDYLRYNPTRNRALDMLPLFCHLDELRVKQIVEDDRVKARPTLHYRLPNCMIDQRGWGLVQPWRDWLQVEALANSPEKLAQARDAMIQHMHNPATNLFSNWAEHVTPYLVPELL